MKINLVGRFNHTGVGRHAENFYSYLSRQTHNNLTIQHYEPNDNAALAHMLMSDTEEDITLFSNIQNPKFLKLMKGRKIYWFFFESQIIPSKLATLLLDYDQVWTPSQWGFDALRQSGLSAEKLRVMPSGVDASIYHPRSISHTPFVFLLIAKYEKRKGVDELVQAFFQEFPRHVYPSIQLWLKADFAILPERINELKARTHHDDRIKIFDQDMREQDILTLYNTADAFIFPSRAEGFGLPCLEALACGLPVAAINYSGQTEYLKHVEGLYIPIEYDMEDIHDPVYESFVREVYAGEYMGQWARPNIDSIRKAMKEIYDHQQEWKVKGNKASEIVRRKFHWEQIAGNAKNEFEKMR